MMRLMRGSALAALLLVVAGTSCPAQSTVSVEGFYRDKRVRMLVGYGVVIGLAVWIAFSLSGRIAKANLRHLGGGDPCTAGGIHCYTPPQIRAAYGVDKLPQQGDGVLEVLDGRLLQLVRRVVAGVVHLRLGRHHLVEQLALAVFLAGFGVGLRH